MFLDEMMPILRELTQQPIAFAGGFFSGLLRLNLADDPVKSWLDQQAETAVGVSASGNGQNGGRQPRSISID